MKIIDKIIYELADKSNNLTDVLIKTKILAFQLKNTKLINWLDHELNGYESEDIPEYRKLTCQIFGTLSNGIQRVKNFQIPLFRVDDELRSEILKVNLTQSVSTLEEFIHNNESRKMIMNLPPEIYGFLSKGLDNGFVVEYARKEIDRSQVIQVLTSVRTKLLDFLLMLNEELGEGNDISTLSQGELKEKVSNMFNSSVFGDNTTIIIGNNNTQTITNISQGNFESLKKLLKDNGLSDVDIQELQQAINSDKPNYGKKDFGPKVKAWISKMMQKAIDGSWKISLGAAGNILANGIKMYYGWE